MPNTQQSPLGEITLHSLHYNDLGVISFFLNISYPCQTWALLSGRVQTVSDNSLADENIKEPHSRNHRLFNLYIYSDHGCTGMHHHSRNTT